MLSLPAADPVSQDPMLAPSRSFRWQRHSHSLARRRLDIFRVAARYCLMIWRDRGLLRLNPDRKEYLQRRQAEWLTRQILDLGPTFIKIGQALSTRADLLPRPYVDALKELQDQVPGFDANEAIRLIESELGSSVRSLFRHFEPIPIAAASLGQVHLATLHTDEQVVVKVQRPGLETLFTLDLKVLHQLVRFCLTWSAEMRQFDLEAIYHEFVTILYQEINYVQEGKNADRFRENFQADPRVRVPHIHWRYTTTKILTMEYLPGIKVNDRQTLEDCGVDAKAISRLGIYCYLKQLLYDGFFQADPHPGNMAVDQEGRLIFYDFGMMAEVRSIAKEKMVDTFFAVLKKDSKVLIDTLIDLGLLQRTSDMTPVRRMATYVLDKFTEKPLDVQAFGEMRSELYEMFEQQPFRMPAQMTFVLKALTTLDGIARDLDPEYNLVAAAQPFVKTYLISSNGRGQILGGIVKQTRSFVQDKLQRPNPVEQRLATLEDRLEQGQLQIRVRSQENERLLRRINMALKSLIYTCWTGCTLVAGAIFLLSNHVPLAILSLILSGLGLLVLLRSLIQLKLRENLDRFAER